MAPQILYVVQLAVLVAGFGSAIAYLFIVLRALRESFLQALLCLFCGPYGLYYVVTRWQQCKVPFVVSCLFSVAGVGGSVFLESHQAEAAVERDRVDNSWVPAFVPRFGSPSEPARETTLEEDLKSMQGQWVVTSQGGDEKFSIRGDRCTIFSPRDQQVFSIRLSVEDGARSVDLVTPGSGQTVRGIYLLRDEKVYVCLAPPGHERPGIFKSEEGVRQLFILRRER